MQQITKSSGKTLLSIIIVSDKNNNFIPKEFDCKKDKMSQILSEDKLRGQ